MTTTLAELLARIPAPAESGEVSTVRRLPIAANDGELRRPKTRGDCVSVPRPCPYARCRHNMTGDGNQRGTYSCALDAADEGGMTLADVGKELGLSRERIRQLENSAFRKIPKSVMRALKDFVDFDTGPGPRARIGVWAGSFGDEDPEGAPPDIEHSKFESFSFLQDGGEEYWNDRVFSEYLRSSEDRGVPVPSKWKEGLDRLKTRRLKVRRPKSNG